MIVNADAVVRSTIAVVVTHQPDLARLAEQFAVLEADGIRAVVVDNGSREQPDIAACAERFGFEFVALPENVGIAAAHNIGFDRVRALDGRHVFLLDHDSIPTSGQLSHLATAICLLEGVPVAGVGSRFTHDGVGKASGFKIASWFRFRKLDCDDDLTRVHAVDTLISSGTIIPISTIDAVGPMREDLFIDRVDTEWFLRAATFGYQAYGSCAAVMVHPIGTRPGSPRFRWAGRVPSHTPERYFYQTRNTIWLYRQEHVPWKWTSADLPTQVKRLLSVMCEPDAAPRLREAWRGLIAGVRVR